MENLEIYEKVRIVPDNAKRRIEAGRLKGKTDINPMWRIKTLTEQFGPCGKGWFFKITDKRLETAVETGEVAAFLDIELYVKFGQEWSQPIQGTGGSMFVVEEKNGLHVSDECFKMALTDAISVACKSLGIGADVYWEKDESKYNESPESPDKTGVKKTRASKPSDVLNFDGADKADYKTLFVNALKIAGLTPSEGRNIIDDMYGNDITLSELDDEQFISLLKKLDGVAVERR
ncbi:MAG: hypothetical protein HFK08_08275 [Clostridia bacterium]|jgi:hypothetical protein|nr:hypothetical protein [Clostridia bacterium]